MRVVIRSLRGIQEASVLESGVSGSLARRSTPALSDGETERVYSSGSDERRGWPRSLERGAPIRFFHQLRGSTLYAWGWARSSCTVTTCCGPDSRPPRTEHPVAHDEEEEEIPETGAFAPRIPWVSRPYDRKERERKPKKRERDRESG